jgi:hypothetical protein
MKMLKEVLKYKMSLIPWQMIAEVKSKSKNNQKTILPKNNKYLKRINNIKT